MKLSKFLAKNDIVLIKFYDVKRHKYKYTFQYRGPLRQYDFNYEWVSDVYDFNYHNRQEDCFEEIANYIKNNKYLKIHNPSNNHTEKIIEFPDKITFSKINLLLYFNLCRL